jgi:hypothetical protein
MEASRLTARAGARALAATARFSDLAVTLDARDLRASALDVTGAADMTLAATAVLPPELVRGIRALPVLEMEPPLAAAVGRNLGPMRITMKAQGARRDGT